MTGCIRARLKFEPRPRPRCLDLIEVLRRCREAVIVELYRVAARLLPRHASITGFSASIVLVPPARPHFWPFTAVLRPLRVWLHHESSLDAQRSERREGDYAT